MNKKERYEYVTTRATYLARSGGFDNWMQIEVKIRNEGYHDARQILDNKSTSHELNELCEQSKSNPVKVD
jgi:hypothetical protein